MFYNLISYHLMFWARKGDIYTYTLLPHANCTAHSVGLKGDGTTGHLEVDTPWATVPSSSTCDRHMMGHWSVALFKQRGRRRETFNCPSVCGASSRF